MGIRETLIFDYLASSTDLTRRNKLRSFYKGYNPELYSLYGLSDGVDDTNYLNDI
ncbi:hypothetical protein GCM10009647_024870 [Streptomyces sanglieri]